MNHKTDRADLDYWLEQLAPETEPEKTPFDPFTSGREFVIYGAGNRGREALQLLQKRGCVVRGFLDREGAPGKTIDGIPCVQLKEHETLGDLSAVSVLIAIFNPGLAITPIYDELRASGFENVFSFYDLDAVFHESLGDFYWLTRRSFWQEHAAEIKRLAFLFTDDESRRSLAAILALRLAGDFATYEAQLLPMKQQYFAPGVADWRGVKNLIDCGAFDGDTIERALEFCDLQSVAAFEPDEENFRALSGRFRRGDFQPVRGLLWPCGVWSETTMLRFSAGQQTSSCIDERGDSVIACTTLDEAVMDFKPDYIKMDIEGAEPRALEGARETIVKHRPLLSICLYHEPQHLWSIPFLIASWDLEYQFFLRSSHFHGFEAVLYAVPQAKTINLKI